MIEITDGSKIACLLISPYCFLLEPERTLRISTQFGTRLPTKLFRNQTSTCQQLWQERSQKKAFRRLYGQV
jgi:hypothetical protein